MTINNVTAAQARKLTTKVINVDNYLKNVNNDNDKLRKKCIELLNECRNILKNHNIEFNMNNIKNNIMIINHVFAVLKLELKNNFNHRILFTDLSINMRKE